MSRVVLGRDNFLEEITPIYYKACTNKFMDENGYNIFNIHRILSPNVVFLFRHKKDDMLVYGVNGEYIELIYEDCDYEKIKDLW